MAVILLLQQLVAHGAAVAPLPQRAAGILGAQAPVLDARSQQL